MCIRDSLGGVSANESHYDLASISKALLALSRSAPHLLSIFERHTATQTSGTLLTAQVAPTSAIEGSCHQDFMSKWRILVMRSWQNPQQHSNSSEYCRAGPLKEGADAATLS
eukprot:4007775-Amphidinium_carterae.1